MLKRKLMIDNTTIKAYKELVKAGIMPPEIVPEVVTEPEPMLEAKPEPIRRPETRRRPSKRRGNYYIYTNTGVISKTGYIMDLDGLKVGVCKVGTRHASWDITDILTGCLIGSAAKLNNVPHVVEVLRPLLEEKRKDDFLIKAAGTIAAAYKAA